MTRDFYKSSLSLTGWPFLAGVFAVGFITGALLL